MSTTIAEAAASTAAAPRSPADVLRRADGIELIGEFEGSGFREPPRLARRRDGQVVQLSELLFAVAEAADGRRDADAVAGVVSERCGRTVSPDNVRVIAERKLRPLGVLALADGSTPVLEKRAPVMALRHRRPLLSERAVNAGARLFTWLHRPLVTVAMLGAVAAFDVWLFGVHGIAGGLRSAIYNPVLLLAVLGSVVVATAFHEFGHASACRYGGARPGVMGVGLYLVWPAFYCDVTDAYRLGRGGRLRTDLGGVYFNAIFALLAGGVFLATGEEAALLAAVMQHVILLQQLLPLLRFDGYYVLTDLTGVPDILSRIKPIFRSLVRGQKHEPKVAELKPWVRVVVTTYLGILIPALLLLFTWMIIATPRVLATVHDSLGLQLDRIQAGAGPAEIALGAVRTTTLVLPLAAMSLSLGRTTKMAGRGLVNWSRGSAPRKALALAGTIALVGAAGYTLWPNGDYEPIRPGEKGTIGEALAAVPDAAGGRPSFTPERELEYGSAPTEREAEAARRERREGAAPQSERDAPADGETYLDEDDPPPSDDGWDHTTAGGATQPAPSGTTTGPGTTTTTEPAPTTTTAEPAPTDTGTSTTTQPAPTSTDGTSTTTTETTPTTTDTTPSTTDTAPRTTDTSTTDSTSVAPDTTAP